MASLSGPACLFALVTASVSANGRESGGNGTASESGKWTSTVSADVGAEVMGSGGVETATVGVEIGTASASLVLVSATDCDDCGTQQYSNAENKRQCQLCAASECVEIAAWTPFKQRSLVIELPSITKATFTGTERHENDKQAHRVDWRL